VTTASSSDMRPRHRRRWRLRVLLGVNALMMALFIFTRLDRSQVAAWGSPAVALHDVFAPPIDMEWNEAEKRFVASIKSIGGQAQVFRQPERLERLLGRPYLFMVQLPGAHFGDRDLAELVKTWGHYIASLDLRHTKVTDSGLRQLRGLASLEHLVLGNWALPGAPAPVSSITDAGLLQLRELPSLHDLWLDNLPITDAGLEHLDELPGLRTLHLAGTQVRGDCLNRWRLLRQMNALFLDNTPLTDQGLSNLASASRLQCLSLRGVPLSQQGLTFIQRLRGLSWVDLAGCLVAPKDLTLLEQRMPGVAINVR
jgi:hypothetical protein